MLLQTAFEVPSAIAGGLATGEMVRRGGTVQWAKGTAKAGEVVAWLRETEMQPLSSAQLASGPFAKAGQLLQVVGSVASVLNLGATVGFGVATLRKLGRMDAKLDNLVSRSDHLQETVDLGFIQMAAGFERLVEGQTRIEERIDEQFHHQVVGAIRSATRDLDLLVTPFPPDDERRGTRLEGILNRVSPAYEILAQDAESRVRSLSRRTAECSAGRLKLDFNEADLTALLRLRMACSAAALKARIIAEAGHPNEAATFLREESERLHGGVMSLGESMFRSGLVYDDLLNSHWATRGIDPARVGRWAARFDPEAGGLEGAIRRIQEVAQTVEPLDSPRPDLLRHPALLAGIGIDGQPRATNFSWRTTPTVSQVVRESLQLILDKPTLDKVCQTIREARSPRITRIDGVDDWSHAQTANVPLVFDLLDGAWEDLDRLVGYAAEYGTMVRLRIAPSEYAERFRVDEVPDGATLVIFTGADSDQGDLPVQHARATVG